MELGQGFLSLRNDLVVRSVRIRGIIEALEPLHIGGEKGTYANYINVLKDHDGKPFIPGTSLKGVLRSLVEIEYSRLGVPVCPGSEIDLSLLADDPDLLQEVRSRYGRFVDRLRVKTCGDLYSDTIWGLSSTKQGDVQRSLEELDRELCEACRLFGTNGFYGSLTVFDATPVQYRLGTRPSLYVEGRKFFKIEYVEDGSTFSFSLSMRNPANYMIGAIVLALKDLKDGRFKIGGFKSRGFGLVTLKDMTMEIRNYSDASFQKKDSMLYMKPLDRKDVEVKLESEVISDPGFFEKTEQFMLALKKAFSGGVANGKR